MAGANGPSKSDRALAGATCGRQALLWSPRFRRKRARALAGANCGRGAALRLGLGLASIGLTEKRRGQSRAAQRQSVATFTLYSGFFFARLDAGTRGRAEPGRERGRLLIFKAAIFAQHRRLNMISVWYFYSVLLCCVSRFRLR